MNTDQTLQLCERLLDYLEKRDKVLDDTLELLESYAASYSEMVQKVLGDEHDPEQTN